jgi:hypothetical protein
MVLHARNNACASLSQLSSVSNFRRDRWYIRWSTGRIGHRISFCESIIFMLVKRINHGGCKLSGRDLARKKNVEFVVRSVPSLWKTVVRPYEHQSGCTTPDESFGSISALNAMIVLRLDLLTPYNPSDSRP